MAGPKRFFVENIGEVAELAGEEFEHAKNVLRLGVGDEVILLDNSGKEYTAVISAVEKRRMLLSIVRTELGTREADTEVCLLFGYLKNADKNEFIIQKAVELGVKKIGVFSSEYSSAYMNENKLERLNKELAQLQKRLAQSEGKLKNQGFVSKAPAAVVEGVRKQAEKEREQLALIEAAIAALQ